MTTNKERPRKLVEDSKALAMSKLVRNWYALDPPIFEGVDMTALTTHLTRIFVAGGMDALIEETGLGRELLHELLEY